MNEQSCKQKSNDRGTEREPSNGNASISNLVILEQRPHGFLKAVESDDDGKTGSLQVFRRGGAFDRVEKRKNLSGANESRNSGRKGKRSKEERVGIGSANSTVRRRKIEPTINAVLFLEGVS